MKTLTTHASMTELHGATPDVAARTPWLWSLPKAAARRLPRAGAARWLAVTEGRVWLTRSGRELEPGDDIWLSAGEHLLLPAGSEWVVEGWPQAQVAMLEAPQADDAEMPLSATRAL